MWLIAAILLVAAETVGGQFFLLMLGGGALGTAAFAALADSAPVWSQGVVFGVISVLLLMLARPPLMRRFSRTPWFATNSDALPGKLALVLESVNTHAGQVKVDGEVWTARPLEGSDVYPSGTTVTVVRIDGATAVVWKEP